MASDRFNGFWWQRSRSRPPTMAEVEADRRQRCQSFFKPSKAEAQLARMQTKERKRTKDEQQLDAWSRKVRSLDNYTDRYDGKPVLSGMAGPVPRRGEAHHIEPRANRDVRYDIRNGITLALENHLKVEAGQLRIVGTRFFTVNGKRYINGRFKVLFRKA